MNAKRLLAGVAAAGTTLFVMAGTAFAQVEETTALDAATPVADL